MLQLLWHEATAYFEGPSLKIAVRLHFATARIIPTTTSGIEMIRPFFPDSTVRGMEEF